MLKRVAVAAGRLENLRFDSAVLRGNRWDDPTERDLLVYVPAAYQEGERYPLLLDLVGYTGSGRAHTNWRPFGLSLVERLDRLMSSNEMAPALVVLPDCFTALGGNQYINSVGTGRYMDYLLEEVVPLVESRFSAGGSRERRGVFGKSSGGYGALRHVADRPDFWGAAVCHSGDLYFEYGYLPDLPILLGQLGKYGEDVERFLKATSEKEKLKGDEVMALMMLGMAASYDGDVDAPLGFHLPIDLHTGEMRPERWAKWLEHDPVRRVENAAAGLRTLKGLFLDCGTRDQYRLLWGARMFHQRLDRLEVPHVYEEFDDDHSDVDYRMNRSLPWLSHTLCD